MTRIEDPDALLAEAIDHLAKSTSWTLTPRPDFFHPEAAVRPGLQWHRMERLLGGDAYAALIRDGYAYLYGVWQAPMVGYARSDKAIEAVIGDRWLRCDATTFLEAGSDHSVLNQVLGRFRTDDPAEPIEVIGVEATPEGPVAMLAGAFGMCAIRLTDPDATGGDDGPRLIGLGTDPEAGVMADLSYGEGELTLPDLDERGVITLEEAMEGFVARRKAKPVAEPDLPTDWGLETGYEAEERVLQLLAQEAPDSIIDVDAGSDGNRVIDVDAAGRGTADQVGKGEDRAQKPPGVPADLGSMEAVAQALADVLRRETD